MDTRRGVGKETSLSAKIRIYEWDMERSEAGNRCRGSRYLVRDVSKESG